MSRATRLVTDTQRHLLAAVQSGTKLTPALVEVAFGLACAQSTGHAPQAETLARSILRTTLKL